MLFFRLGNFKEVGVGDDLMKDFRFFIDVVDHGILRCR